jgi:hypothetical protein
MSLEQGKHSYTFQNAFNNDRRLVRIRPSSTIPICLDLGTNNQNFLDDPLYLGLRQRRISDEVMTEFMEEFMLAMSRVFPKLLVQFEVREFAFLAPRLHTL